MHGKEPCFESWECTEHNMEMMHIGARLENMKHAEVSMLWSWKLFYCDIDMRVCICCVECSSLVCLNFEDDGSIFFFLSIMYKK